MVILQRHEDLKRFSAAGPWIFMFGRRKSGKTFFVKKFTKWDEYFFVRRDGAIFDKEGRELSYETFFDLFKRLISEKIIVVDEFHRLPASFSDYLHFLGQKGKLRVISSTLWYSKKLLSTGSPLIGLFDALPFSLVDERDVLRSLRGKGKERIEASTYLREPLLAPLYSQPLRKFISEFLNRNKLAIHEIIGEIFSEEERQLSEVYIGIMRAVASGKGVSTEISSYLFSRKLIPKDNPGMIQRYLDTLVKIGIFEKLEVWRKKKFKYYHLSPLLDLHFYLDEKYGYIESDIPEKFVLDVVNEKVPQHVQHFFRALLSKVFGLKSVVLEEPEIDIALAKFNRIKVLAEVKWKKKVSKEEAKQVESKFGKFKDAKCWLIVPNKNALAYKPKIKILEAKDILKFCKSQMSKRESS